MELTCASTSSTCFFHSPPSPGAHSSRRRLLSSHSKLAGTCFLWKEISVEKSLKMEHQHHLCITQNITIGPSAAGRGKLRVTLCFSLRHMAHWKRCFFSCWRVGTNTACWGVQAEKNRARCHVNALPLSSWCNKRSPGNLLADELLVLLVGHLAV